jgi:hypothetical protein
VPAQRGVGHRHERWVRDAVDAKALLTNGADADGEVVWSWCPALSCGPQDAITPS